MIYVTHDQAEALYMADKIAVLKEGELQQIGPSALVYSKPVNVFVARFLGSINLIEAKLREVANGTAKFITPLGLELNSSAFDQDLRVNCKYLIGIRPEDITMTKCDTGVTGVVKEMVFVGGVHRYAIQADGLNDLLISNKPTDFDVEIGAKVKVSWASNNLIPLRYEDINH